MTGRVRHLWGWLLVTVGIIGLIMPIMPGWVFLIPGLVILSDYSPRARRLLEWAKQKAHIHHGKTAGQDSEEKHAGNPGGNCS